jgi:peptide/nickel transport system permease protein
MIFVFWLNWFPAGGIRQAGLETTGFVSKYLRVDFLKHAILPIMTMTITYLSVPILLMRTSMVETLNADFIKIKRAEGLPERNILYKHAVRNSILPIVTITALASGLMIGGSVVIETVFNWPGMGREMVRAVNNQDFPLAQGLFFFMGATVMMMNLVADLAYVYLDPRIQYD